MQTFAKDMPLDKQNFVQTETTIKIGVKGGESSSQFQWLTIAKIEL